MKASKCVSLAALLVLASCGPLVSLGNDGPPPALFTLPSGSAAAPEGSGPPAFASIRVEEMEPGPELRSERIAVTATDVGVQYLTGARWVDGPQVLLQRSLIDAFARWGEVTALGSTNLEVPTDVRLTGRIERFHLDVSQGAPTVQLAVQTLMIKTRGGTILGSRRFEASAPAASAKPEDVARAFATAHSTLVADIYRWSAPLKP